MPSDQNHCTIGSWEPGIQGRIRSDLCQLMASSWSVPGDILVGIRPDPGQFQVISGSVSGPDPGKFQVISWSASGQILVTGLSGAC